MAILRGLVILVVVVAAVGTVGLTARWAVLGRPDPESASRQALLRYLATADVSLEPLEFQQALIARLEEELRQGMPVDGAAQAGPSYRKQLAANVGVLKERWFNWRVEQYSHLSAPERPAFLDARIQTVLAWARLDAALRGNAQPQAGQSSTAGFFDEIAGWMRAEADSQRRQQMEQAVQDGLVQWLATRDLAEQSPAVRRELALRITGKLDDGLSLTGTLGERQASERAMLRSNGQLLMEAWLLAQAEAYFQLEPSRQGAFIDERLAQVQRWGVMELVGSEEGGDEREGPASTSGAMVNFLTLAQQWIERAPPQQQTQLRGLLQAVQGRLLARWLQNTLQQR